ncbi:hypothetical protein EUX98_g2470 [Antrodiella citrinella]|uniref:N-acetyltransferase domain-containing protein n=1 Tax=Antrodiella citrinella TaxID=2447956 RepID=A0A4S4MYX3_9APHY|nr:hypothetical protein EUX98_g2470 [Antrodiella citrinella]
MTRSQLYPLQTDPETGEPFFRLPAPLENIIITPARPTDVTDLITVLDNPAVYKWLDGAPHPFLEEHAMDRSGKMTNQSEQVLKEMRKAEEAFPNEPRQFASGSPVNVIREVQADGSQVYVGDIKVYVLAP